MSKRSVDYQRERREKGLCCSCGNQALSGRSRCQKCTDRAKERYHRGIQPSTRKPSGVSGREKYLARKAARLCVSCGTVPALPDSVYCQAHLDAQRQRQRIRAAVQADTCYTISSNAKVTGYEARKLAGLCVVCGTAPALPGYVHCQKHLDEQRRRQKIRAAQKKAGKEQQQAEQQEERQALGCCIGCGSEEVFMESRCRCCYAIHSENNYGLTRYAARKQAGLCQCCNELANSTTRCTKHEAERRQLYIERKTKKICTSCGKAHTGQASACKECLAAKTALYKARQETGCCPHCGSKDAIAPGKHCAHCRAINRKKNRKKHRKLRAEVLQAYGGVCQCCGEPTPEFLQVDHVNNDGASHRKEIGVGGLRLYTWLRQHNYPKEGFQLLCANCNFAKGHYGHCPHEQAKFPT